MTGPSLAAVFVIGVAIMIIWSNPARRVNQAVFAGCVQMALWLVCLHTTIQVHGALFWLRLTCVVGGLTPVTFWLVKETIQGNLDAARPRWLFRNAWLLAVFATIMLLPTTEAFIPSHSTPEMRIRGWGYFAYMWLLLATYAWLLTDAMRQTRRLTGGAKLELQLWLVGGCLLAFAVLATMALNTVTGDRRFIRIQPLLVIAFYTGVAGLLTTGRIFDARQVALLVLQKVLLVAAVIGVAWALHRGVEFLLPESVALFVTAGLALWLASVLDGRLSRVFQFYPEATVARSAAFEAARSETQMAGLERAFLDVLTRWGRCERAVVLVGPGALQGGGIEWPESSPALEELRKWRWVTIERLNRERSSPARRELGDFLQKHGLTAAVLTPGPTLTMMAGVGMPASRRPYTYPQVQQLGELASIMESAFERVHYFVRAQRAEQLATVGVLGASLAHEIRNPLVTIKTFVQLLPKHYQDQNFRDKFFHLIGDEVTRIDRLTEQLLNLSSPRSYRAQPLSLHAVLESAGELITPKAADKRVEFRTEMSAGPDRVLSDASAVTQVVLNLCFNAIQAVEHQPEPRWVKLSTRNVSAGVEMIVEDNGPGIAPGIRPRLFQPFQSTKSSGFGLGLAICSDILADLDATITADPSEPGRGAVLRVRFPCPA